MNKYIFVFLSIFFSVSHVNSAELEKWVYEFDGTNYNSLTLAENALKASETYTQDYELYRTTMEESNIFKKTKNIIRHYKKPDKNAESAGESLFGHQHQWNASSIAEWVSTYDADKLCPDEFQIVAGPFEEKWEDLNGDGNGPALGEGEVFTAVEWRIYITAYSSYNTSTGYDCFVSSQAAEGSPGTSIWKVNPKICPEFYNVKDPQPLCTPGGNFKTKTILNKRIKYCTGLEGNPCSPITGQKIETVTDYSVNDLFFRRIYNSSNEMALIGGRNQPIIGNGWTHNFSARFRKGQYLVSEEGNVYNVISDNQIDSSEYAKYEDTAEFYVITRSDGSGLRFHKSIYENNSSELLLDSLIDVNGNVTQLDYLDAGDGTYQLDKVTGPNGHQLEFKYGAAGKISELVLPNADEISYTYEQVISDVHATSILREVVYPDSHSAQYHYEDNDFPYALTGISEDGERYGTYVYDDFGRVIESGHVDGADKILLNYKEDGSTDVTYADGSVKTFSISQGTNGAKDKPYSISQLGQNSYYIWESEGQRRLLEETAPSGLVTEYEYDGQELAKVTKTFDTEVEADEGGCGVECDGEFYEECGVECGGGNSGSFQTTTKSVSKVTEYEYMSSVGVLVTKVTTNSVSENPDHKKEISIVYDDTFSNKPTSITVNGFSQSGESVSSTSSILYDSRGNVESKNGPRGDVEDITYYEYYDCQTGSECGQLSKTLNAKGHVTLFNSYDAHGRLLQMTDSNGVLTEFQYYSSINSLVSKVLLIDGGSIRETGFDYYPNGLIKSLTLQSGASYSYEYDSSNNLTKVIDGLGNQINYEFDLRGNVTSTSYINTVGEKTFTTSAEFDEFNRLIKSINGNNIENTKHYDLVGNNSAFTNGLTDQTSASYDGLRRLISKTNAMGGVSFFEYNIANFLTKVSDAEGKSTIYKYDDLGNVLEVSSPDTGVTLYSYDLEGNLTSKTDARGVTVVQTYDSLNRIISQTYEDPIENTYYFYDDILDGNMGIGRLTKVTDASGSTSYFYNGFGQIIKETRVINGVSFVTEYIYSENGQLIEIIYPGAGSLHVDYNSLGKVLKLSLSNGGSAKVLIEDIQYMPFGALKSAIRGNSEILTQSFDLGYRLTEKTDGNEHGYSYSYDLTDNITVINDLINSEYSQSFEYDVLARLTGGQGHYGELEFSYDQVGNRLTKTSDNGSDEYEYNEDSHQLGSLIGNVNIIQTFDEAGNTLTKGDLVLSYGQRGRLSNVENDEMDASYNYNFKGERVSKSVNGIETLFIYDIQGLLIAESTNEGKVVKQYYYLNGIPYAMEELGTNNSFEYVLDDTAAELKGEWKESTAVAGYQGDNYLFHAPNSPTSNGVVIDNESANLIGKWQHSSSVSGYWGNDYLFATAEQPNGGIIFDSEDTTTDVEGSWKNSTSVSGYNGVNYLTAAAGTGSKQVHWNISTIETSEYKVYARWTAHGNRASNATYKIDHVGGNSNITVNQREKGNQWNLLGNFTLNSSSMVSIDNNVDGWVVADAIMIVPADATSNSATWDWQADKENTLDVYARWSAHENRATNATYEVSTSSGFVQNVTVDQTELGGEWNLLESVYLSQGELLTVKLSDQADGYVIADAIQIVASGEKLENSAIWKLSDVIPGEYEIQANWTAHANRAGDAVYAIEHSNGIEAVVANQRENGGSWQTLGTYQVDENSSISLNDQANGYVIADAIRLVSVDTAGYGGLYYYHNDHLGTPLSLSDESGDIKWKASYTPFGKANIELSDIVQNIRFPGQYFDEETGMHYNYFRDYDPEIGRYIQSDPIGLNGGLNSYSYVRGNPKNRMDVNGLLDVFIGGFGDSKHRNVKNYYDRYSEVHRDSRDTRYFEWDDKDIVNQLIAYKCENPEEAINIVGHSFGGDSAAEVSQELTRAGVAPDLLITVDPVSFWSPNYIPHPNRGGTFWMNINATPSTSDNSDIVAEDLSLGGKWDTLPENQVDLYLEADENHGSFGSLFTSPNFYGATGLNMLLGSNSSSNTIECECE